MPAAGGNDEARQRVKRKLASVRRRLDGGQKRYVWTRGVIAAGIPLFILGSLLPSLGLVPWLTESLVNPLYYICAGAFLWAVAGYLWGVVLWRSLEWRHEALVRKVTE